MEVGDQLQDPAPWYPLKRRLGGAHTQSDRVGEWKNSQPLPGPETPIIKPAAQRYTTELSWLPLTTKVQDKITVYWMLINPLKMW